MIGEIQKNCSFLFEQSYAYRGEYTIEIYNIYVQPIEEISHDAINMGLGTMYMEEYYYCRGVKKGIRFDKLAETEVSKMLGHRRIRIVLAHYIR